MEPAFVQANGAHVYPMAWGGSYWHHDIRDREAELMDHLKPTSACAYLGLHLKYDVDAATPTTVPFEIFLGCIDV